MLASVETFRYCKAIEIDREWGRQQIAELQSIPGFYDTWEKYDDDNAHATRKVTKPLFPNLTKASLNILKDVSWLSHDFERRWASRKPHRVLNEGCFLTNIEELIIDKLSGPSIASIARLPAISYLIDFTGLDLGNLSTVCIMTEEKDDTLVFTIYQRGPGTHRNLLDHERSVTDMTIYLLERRRTVTEESD